jgi:hypothetical protein
MREPVEERWATTSVDAYDQGRRAACADLLAGTVRTGAAQRLVELALSRRRQADELGEIFAETERIARAPGLADVTRLAGRATAAHACGRRRSLEATITAISVELDRRFSDCEAGQAAYPLNLAGLGLAGRRVLEADVCPFSVTHALERIIESALLVATVVAPACAPGAYAVRAEPRRTTRAEVHALLAGSLAAEQNATIDFALEDPEFRPNREARAFEHLQCVVLALRPQVDLQGLVAHAHALLSSVDDQVELDAEIGAAAGILDGSGLATQGTLALGEAVGEITKLAAGLVSCLHRTITGIDGRVHAAELARSVLQAALVVAWCTAHGRIRPGVVTIDGRPWS